MTRLPLPIAARVRRWRTIEGGAPRALGVGASLPMSAGPLVEGDALWLEPRVEDRSTPWGLVAILPEPETMRRALIFIAPAAPRDGFFARLVGGERPLPRAIRGAALLLKGYGMIGGGIDPVSALDLAWGEACALEADAQIPTASASSIGTAI
jgi:hypothetical protein